MMKFFYRFLIFLLVLTSVNLLSIDPGHIKQTLSNSPGQLMTTTWPMFRHDNQHTGRTEAKGPDQPGLLWKFQTGGYVLSSPAVGSDGMVYCGSGDGKMYAIHSNGQLAWQYTTGAPIRSSPTLCSEGRIYFGSEDGVLYALNPAGELIWSFPVEHQNGGIQSSPAVGNDGTVYFGSYTGNFYAVSSSGNLEWVQPIGQVEAAPAIGFDGTIYVGSYYGGLSAILPAGAIQWNFGWYTFRSSPAVGPDGTVYVGLYEPGYLFAFTPSGELKWMFPVGDMLYSSPAIGDDGTIYVGSINYTIDYHNYGSLLAITPEGQLKWEFSVNSAISSSPAIDGEGVIYFGTESGYLYAITPTGELKWVYDAGSAIVSSPAIGQNRTLYFGTDGGSIVAIGDDLFVGEINVQSTNPSPVLTNFTVTATFADPNPVDSHTATWSWGDGTTTIGDVNDSSDYVSGSHTYSGPGVYSITLIISDTKVTATRQYQYIVVYDPSGGFVTGGGWINSPPGAYQPNPSLTGKANFGFEVKYKKRATVPSGNTEFQFHAGNLNFHSTSFEWLVIASKKAQFKGEGTINGSGSYRFFLTVIDGQYNGAKDPDKFRIKIWDRNTNTLVYDNLLNAPDDADPTTVIGGGNIVIHKP